MNLKYTPFLRQQTHTHTNTHHHTQKNEYILYINQNQAKSNLIRKNLDSEMNHNFIEFAENRLKKKNRMNRLNPNLIKHFD